MPQFWSTWPIFPDDSKSLLQGGFFNWSAQFSVPKWKTSCSRPGLVFHEIFNVKKFLVGWASFFHFGTENRADQLKKPPCMSCLTKMTKFVIWPWTGWTNQQTSAHQKRPNKPRKLLAKGCGNAKGGPCHRKDHGKDQHTKSESPLDPPSCYSHVHCATNIHPQSFFHIRWKWWAHNRFCVVKWLHST